MGAWRFVKAALVAGPRGPLRPPVTRTESASPATGSAAVHKQEQEQLLDDAFEGL